MVVVGLGKKGAGVDDQENWHEGKENIRAAVAGDFPDEVYYWWRFLRIYSLKLFCLPSFGPLTITTPTMFTEK